MKIDTQTRIRFTASKWKMSWTKKNMDATSEIILVNNSKLRGMFKNLYYQGRITNVQIVQIQPPDAAV